MTTAVVWVIGHVAVIYLDTLVIIVVFKLTLPGKHRDVGERLVFDGWIILGLYET